jgi:competence protein ComEC
LVALLGFFVLRTFSFINADSQRKIIVYNVPQKQAIDFIDGRNYFFEGDADLLADDFIRNFHIKPSRVLHRTGPGTVVIRYRQADKLIEYNGKKILLLDTTVYFSPLQEKLNVDILVISKNPRIYFSKLVQMFDIKQVVFDGSAASRKLKYWKKDCDSLRIPYHDVTEKGAFQMKIR